MQKQRAFVGGKEQILSSTRTRSDGLPFQIMDAVRDRPAKAFVPDDDLSHCSVNEPWGDAAQGGFDFG
jgi:hypothetical protein